MIRPLSLLIAFVCFPCAVSAGEEPSPSVSVGSSTEIQAAGLGESRGFLLPVHVTEPAKVVVTVRLLTFVEGKMHQSCKFDYQWNKKGQGQQYKPGDDIVVVTGRRRYREKASEQTSHVGKRLPG